MIPVFRVLTTMIGMNVVDIWQSYKFHCTHQHRQKKIDLMFLAEMLCYDMLHNNLPKQRSCHNSLSFRPPTAKIIITPTIIPNNCTPLSTPSSFCLPLPSPSSFANNLMSLAHLVTNDIGNERIEETVGNHELEGTNDYTFDASRQSLHRKK